MLLSLTVSSHLSDLNNSKGCFPMEFLISYHCEGEKKKTSSVGLSVCAVGSGDLGSCFLKFDNLQYNTLVR